MFKVINISVLAHDSNNINHLISDVMDAFDEPKLPGPDFYSGRIKISFQQPPKLVTKKKSPLFKRI